MLEPGPMSPEAPAPDRWAAEDPQPLAHHCCPAQGPEPGFPAKRAGPLASSWWPASTTQATQALGRHFNTGPLAPRKHVLLSPLPACFVGRTRSLSAWLSAVGRAPCTQELLVERMVPLWATS